MRWCTVLVLFVSIGGRSSAAAAGESYESLAKASIPVETLKHILLPFVATCDRERDHFRKLFCSALNERLKAQHQSKIYRSTFEPSAAGPLTVSYNATPRPSLELTVRGCLTCKEPMLDRAGGDISKARFFLFKTPKDIKIGRGKQLYELEDINMETYRIELPPTIDEKKFEEQIFPFLRLDLLYRPVAGVTKVGGKYKYGVTTFDLLGYRVYDHCSGVVYGTSPKMEGKFLVDKRDMSCPQNQPKKPVAKIKLPAALPQAEVQVLMRHLSDDLQACYEQFGVAGEVPAELLISPQGKVKSVKISGKLSSTPTAQCVERLIKDLSFPKFSGDDARLQWPLSLRN